MECCEKYSTKWYLRFWFANAPTVQLMLALLIVLASSASVIAEEIGNAKAGREYAIDHCASCHAIYGSDTESVNPNAAPFAEIAVTPGMNARALTVWLGSVHNEMPDFIIEKNDMENVIAYILSLAPKQRPQL
jgi:mono/diheme cytochrome c family protein